jgi:hypothetical protein
MNRLTLEEYKDIRKQVESLEREIIASLAEVQVTGLAVLNSDAKIAEIRSLLRKRRPIMRRKKEKKVFDEETPRLVYSSEKECWRVA